MGGKLGLGKNPEYGTYRGLTIQIVLYNFILLMPCIARCNISFVLDEAHTIPSWGLEFRRGLIDVSFIIGKSNHVQKIFSSATLREEEITFLAKIHGVSRVQVSVVNMRKELTYSCLHVSSINESVKSIKGIQQEISSLIEILSKILEVKSS